MTHKSTAELLEELAERLTRVESRLVQLMLHVGLDPYQKTYPSTAPPREEKE